MNIHISSVTSANESLKTVLMNMIIISTVIFDSTYGSCNYVTTTPKLLYIQPITQPNNRANMHTGQSCTNSSRGCMADQCVAVQGFLTL